MIDKLRDLELRVRRLQTSLGRIQGKQVFSRQIKNAGRGIVDDYFRQHRELMTRGGFTDDALERADASMHLLLDNSNHAVAVGTFRRTVKACGIELLELEKRALALASAPVAVGIDPVDAMIIETLTRIVPSAANSYQQAIADLIAERRTSWRGPATDMREALRETLDHLAPDKEVAAQQNFKLEKDQAGPTQKQKVRYVLSKRGMGRSETGSAENAAEAVDEILGKFVRSVYTRSNVSTHTPTDKNEVLRVRQYVRAALCELLEIHL